MNLRNGESIDKSKIVQLYLADVFQIAAKRYLRKMAIDIMSLIL